jgi:hypothetical protein
MRIRHFRPIEVLHLMISDLRRIGIAPNLPLAGGSGRPYLQAVGYHLVRAIIYLTLFEGLLLPLVKLSPDGFGSPYSVKGDFVAWTKDLGQAYGIPWVVVWLAFAYTYMIGGIIASMDGTYHLLAAITIATGLYVDEEWPEMFGSWWKCSSLNEFWGKEYHQVSIVTSDFDIVHCKLTSDAASRFSKLSTPIPCDSSSNSCLSLSVSSPYSAAKLTPLSGHVSLLVSTAR